LPQPGIGFVGVAFGRAVRTMAYAVGHGSGGRFKTGDMLPSKVAQVAGAIHRRLEADKKAA
jgi:glycerol uptake facilitator-like aquaporin